MNWLFKQPNSKFYCILSYLSAVSLWLTNVFALFILTITFSTLAFYYYFKERRDEEDTVYIVNEYSMNISRRKMTAKYPTLTDKQILNAEYKELATAFKKSLPNKDLLEWHYNIHVYWMDADKLQVNIVAKSNFAKEGLGVFWKAFKDTRKERGDNMDNVTEHWE